MADCPDCSVKLTNPTSCVCGWQKSKGSKGYISPKGCQFQTNGRKCDMPAATSDGGNWYCGWHYQCLSKPEMISNYVQFEAFHASRQDPWDEEAKKLGLPQSANPWRGTPMRLWQRVGGEHGSNYAGDRKQAAGGSSRSPQDYLNEAKRKLGRSGREEPADGDDQRGS